ncbi:peroxin 8 [Apiospora marii]|uniref:Peroxin 8 n=1 Tax=Apiospora marii TaxID=335849 RepID=A0ABR1SGI9_9PEZI
MSSADRLLTTTLRAFQEPHRPSDVDRLYASTATLLSNLNNHLNISLLTSHLLTARAIWDQPFFSTTDSGGGGLRTCLRILSVYNTAALHVQRNEAENAQLRWGQQPVGSGVRCDAWARAVAKGADDRSERWKHLLVLTGTLMGMESEDRRALSRGLRATLEQAVVTAANLALEENSKRSMMVPFGEELGSNAVMLALAFVFPVLSDHHKQMLNCDLVLPAAVRAMTGPEGFQDGDFLRSISAGNVAGHETFYRASPSSFAQVQQLEARPLPQNMGPLSRLAAFAVQHAADSRVVLESQERLLVFSAGLLERWRHCPFSSVDISTEAAVLPPDMIRGPWAMLWRLLKKIMYTVVATIQPIIGRCLLDPRLRNDATAPMVASKTLHTLRNLCFISSREGADAFQVYVFTYLTSLDIITRYPDACVAFLQETQPTAPGQPNSPALTPLDQALTLFYLNTAEHLPLSLPTPAADTLVLTLATAHLSAASSSAPVAPQTSLTLPLYEAAHASILSVLSCPQHAPLTITLIPFYIDTLLASFPARISPRQFRLAFKTVVQIASPPFPIAASHPHLAETLLEMLHFRAASATTHPLPAEPGLGDNNHNVMHGDQQQQPLPPVSEQTTLVLSLVDALPFLPLPLVEDWLTRTAEAMNAVADPALREVVRKRFWDVLVSGEMDVERAAVGVAWWGIGGGREMVLLAQAAPPRRDGEVMMSGALGGNRLEASRL